MESLEVSETRNSVEFSSYIGNSIVFQITRFYNK